MPYKHGHARKSGKSHTYKKWAGMKRRCDNPNERSYARYGGRGISYDPRWSSFENFLADMGECPPNMTLERLDVDGDYNPENCTWIPPKEQPRNRRDTIHVLYQAQERSLAEWSEILGIPYKTLWHRLRTAGWPVKRAFETPVNDYLEQISYRGKTQHLAAWSRELDIPYHMLYLRLKRYGWTVDRAFGMPAQTR